MKYIKKPVIVEAFCWNDLKRRPKWYFEAIEDGTIIIANNPTQQSVAQIKTFEGLINVSLTDYIIKGVQNEIYSCKYSIFKQNYEKA